MTAATKALQKSEEQTPATVAEKPQKVYIPRADVYETDEAYVLEVDLPGVSQKALDISLEKDVLSIKGTREVGDYEDYKFEYGEYGAGKYERSFSLGDGIDSEKIGAKLENGVLAVTLPKAEGVAARKIEVKPN